MTAALVQALAEAVGADKVVTTEDVLDARRHDYWATSHIRDLAGAPGPRPACVVRPLSVIDVQRVLAVAGDRRAPVIPFGLGSGVVGGVVARSDAIVLDMGAMSAVRFIDETSICWPRSRPARTAWRQRRRSPRKA